MDDWKKFHETSLPEIEDFNSHLNMKDIAMQITRTQKKAFEIKNFRRIS